MAKRLKPPCETGMPEQFTEWRPAQEQAVRTSLESNNRFNVVNAPTGFGKSLVYMHEANEAAKHGERTIITTGTKGLSAQLVNEFSSIGVAEIKGKGNYRCPMQEDYTCLEGHSGKCPYRKTRMCSYTDAHLNAQEAQIVLTNNKMWISSNRFGKGLGIFNRMVIDEAHQLPDELASAMHLRLGPRDSKDILKVDMPRETWNMKAWKEWAQVTRSIASMEAESLREEIQQSPCPTQAEVRHFIRVRNLLRKLIVLSGANPDNWVVEAKDYGLYEFDPISPATYAESVFYRGIPRISLYSATVRKKTLVLSGIWSDYRFTEYPSTFSAERFRISHVPTIKVDRNTTDLKPWTTKIDQIIKPRQDRKGIIHTTSNERKKIVLSNSRFDEIMMANFKDDVTAEVVEEFKQSDPPMILVSPSITTGYDFPGTDCEYQILGKVPFPPSTDKIMQVRQEKDPELGAYIAMMALVQACGRGFRFEQDRCENFVIDDNFIWFWRRYKYLAPGWFASKLRWEDRIPKPEPKLLESNKRRVA